MKKQLFGVCISFVIVALSGCYAGFDVVGVPNEKDRIFSFGRYQNQGDIYYVVEDDGKIIVLNGNIKPDSDLNRRFFVAGRASQETDSKGNDYWRMFVEIMEEANIHPLTVVDSTKNINDFGTSGIFFERNMGYNHIYFSGKYLNFIYSVYSSSTENHTLSFLYNSEKVEYSDNRMTIYIRHTDSNSSNDNRQMLQMYSSLDLNRVFSLINADRITLVINTINLEGEQEEDVFEVMRDWKE